MIINYLIPQNFEMYIQKHKGISGKQRNARSSDTLMNSKLQNLQC